MEPNINNINESGLIDETETVEEIDIEEAIEAAEAESVTEDRPRGRGRGRRGMRGRRPFGPNRPYRFALFVEDDGTYVLRSPDLADRATEVGSLDEVGAAMRSAIEQRSAEDAALAAEAEKDADYSGKFVLRLPRSMHRQLSELAEAEGVSLNQLALTFLAQGMGRMDADHEPGRRRGPRGGHRGPGGHGRHSGRGPEGAPEGRSFDGCGPEGRGPGKRGGMRGFGRGRRGQRDMRPEGAERGRQDRHGIDPERHGRKGHGFHRSRWFMGEAPGPHTAPDDPEPTETSFV